MCSQALYKKQHAHTGVQVVTVETSVSFLELYSYFEVQFYIYIYYLKVRRKILQKIISQDKKPNKMSLKSSKNHHLFSLTVM